MTKIIILKFQILVKYNKKQIKWKKLLKMILTIVMNFLVYIVNKMINLNMNINNFNIKMFISMVFLIY